MFVLRTGLQGNGKTLNTIKEVDIKAHAEGRTVYYCNITGLKADHPALKASWVEFKDPEKWFELPNNAMIVIDEAQTWFRVRPQGSKVPDYASRLEIMRKDGHELHAITQSPKLIDAHMRELCNMHIHYHRGGGGQIIKRWEFQKPELTVNSNKLTFDNGESSRIKIDKTYFGCYQSVKEGTGHHFKFRPPKALFVLVACLLALVGLGYKVYASRIAPQPDQVETLADTSAPGAAPVPVSSTEVPPLTPAQFIDVRTPRLPDVPLSAPIYDELTSQVASYPKALCVSTSDPAMLERAGHRMVAGYHRGELQGCRCNTQQGTRLDVSFDACIAYVEHGTFDPAVPDQGAQIRQEADGGRGPSDVGAGTRPLAAPPQPQPVTVIADGTYSSRPWR